MIQNSDIFALNVEKIDADNADKRIDEVMKYNHRITVAKHSPYEMAFSGLCGEERMARYFNTPIINHKHYDFILNGKKVDVKTTIVKWKPNNNFKVKVFKYFEQNTDYYLFTMIEDFFTPLWVCGIISAKEFKKESFKAEAGTYVDKLFIKEPCRMIEIKKLHKLSEIPECKVKV